MTTRAHWPLTATVLVYSLTPALAQTPRRPPLPPAIEKAAAKEQEAQSPQPSLEGKAQAEFDRELIRIRDSMMRQALDRMRSGDQGSATRIISEIGQFLIFLSILGGFLWILRVLLENRRWHKLARIQSEVHNKLLEKFGSSREFLDYLGSDAGKRFLEWTPLPIEQPASTPFPYGRILWSAQAGVILAFFGLGMWVLRAYLPGPAEQFLILGTLAMSLGMGFILSAVISYLLSRSFGLLERAADAGARESSSGTGS